MLSVIGFKGKMSSVNRGVYYVGERLLSICGYKDVSVSDTVYRGQLAGVCCD